MASSLSLRRALIAPALRRVRCRTNLHPPTFTVAATRLSVGYTLLSPSVTLNKLASHQCTGFRYLDWYTHYLLSTLLSPRELSELHAQQTGFTPVHRVPVFGLAPTIYYHITAPPAPYAQQTGFAPVHQYGYLDPTLTDHRHLHRYCTVAAGAAAATNTAVSITTTAAALALHTQQTGLLCHLSCVQTLQLPEIFSCSRTGPVSRSALSPRASSARWCASRFVLRDLSGSRPESSPDVAPRLATNWCRGQQTGFAPVHRVPVFGLAYPLSTITSQPLPRCTLNKLGCLAIAHVQSPVYPESSPDVAPRLATNWCRGPPAVA